MTSSTASDFVSSQLASFYSGLLGNISHDQVAKNIAQNIADMNFTYHPLLT